MRPRFDQEVDPGLGRERKQGSCRGVTRQCDNELLRQPKFHSSCTVASAVPRDPAQVRRKCSPGVRSTGTERSNSFGGSRGGCSPPPIRQMLRLALLLRNATAAASLVHLDLYSTTSAYLSMPRSTMSYCTQCKTKSEDGKGCSIFELHFF